MEYLSHQEAAILKQLKDKLRQLLGTELDGMVLFGSKARGDAEAGSDLDVAVIVKNLTRDRKRQVLDRVAEVELEHLMPISVLVLSVDAFQELIDRERRLALDIQREGVPL